MKHARVGIGFTLLLAASCGNKNQGPPPPEVVAQDVLVLELMAPPDGGDPAASVCQDPDTGEGPLAWIVKVTAPFEIDENADGNGGYDDSTLTFIFDSEGQRNCPRNPCGRPWIPRLDDAPIHVSVAGTRQDPEVVGDDQQSFDVLCRGETLEVPRDVSITDCGSDPTGCTAAMDGSGTGAALLRADGGYPPQLETQEPEYRRVYNARVRMLGVGRSNALYTSDPFVVGEPVPWLAYPAASGLSDGRVLITGGAKAPGLAEGTAYLFDPAALQVTQLLGMLGGRRAAHTSVRVGLGAAEAERIWLVGGVGEVAADLTGTTPALDSTLVFSNEGIEFTQGPLLAEGRALADVALFRWNSGGADHDRAVVSGGYTTSSLTAFGTGEGTSASAAVFSGEVGPDIVEIMTSTASRAGGHTIIAPDGMSALVVGGYSVAAPADAVNCTDNSAGNRLVDCADVFDPAAGAEGAFAANAMAGTPAVAHPVSNSLVIPGDPNPVAAMIAGGISSYASVSGETATDAVSFYTNAFVGAGQVTLPEPRAHATAETLLDGRVLIVGGGLRNENGSFYDLRADTAVYDPAGFDGSTDFGDITCDNLLTDTVLPDCPQLIAPRVAHATARIRGSSWLNGGILVVGGATDSFLTSGGPDTATDPSLELFLPAYVCQEVLVDVDSDIYENQPPAAIDGGDTGRCDVGRRFNDDNDIYRNGDEP